MLCVLMSFSIARCVNDIAKEFSEVVMPVYKNVINNLFSSNKDMPQKSLEDIISFLKSHNKSTTALTEVPVNAYVALDDLKKVQGEKVYPVCVDQEDAFHDPLWFIRQCRVYGHRINECFGFDDWAVFEEKLKNTRESIPVAAVLGDSMLAFFDTVRCEDFPMIQAKSKEYFVPNTLFNKIDCWAGTNARIEDKAVTRKTNINYTYKDQTTVNLARLLVQTGRVSELQYILRSTQSRLSNLLKNDSLEEYKKMRAKGAECPVCFDDIESSNVILTQCDHVFCKSSISKCKKSNNNCPICRQCIN